MFLKFLSLLHLHVLKGFWFLNVFIVTESSILTIPGVVCCAALPFNHTFKLEGAQRVHISAK